MHPVVTGFLLAAFVASGATPAFAQARKEFRARLSTVPIDVAMQATVTGRGSATGVLTGTRLSITGTFTNLKSPATVARVHLAPKGLRGPSVFDLQVTSGTSGTIAGVFDLTPAQVEALTNSRFYIQLHSEKAPEGNLWGWLLPQEAKR
jgi:hypothetical protein